MARKAGIYVRLSQDREGQATSVRRQEKDCRDLVERRRWEIAGVYRDNDISASGKRRRPEWERMLGDLREGRIDSIAAYSSSRMYRHVRDLLDLIPVVEERGVLIGTCVSGNIDLTTADGRMQAMILASVDQREWEATSERWRAQKRHASAEGRYTGGEREPFGYRRTPQDVLEIDPEEAAGIHDAVARLSRGETATGICREWNRIGLRTSKDARWRPETLRRLLLSEHLVGGRGYPRVLSNEEAAITKAALAREERRVGRPTGLRAPLAGYLRCSECGSRLSTGAGAYRCTLSHGGCGGVSIKAIPLERHVLVESFRRWIDVYGDKQDGERRRESEPDPDTEPLLEELRSLEKRERQIADGLADGTLTVTVAGQATRQVETRRREVTEQLARHLPPPQSKPLVRRPDEIFQPDELRFLGLRVTMFAEHGGAERFATLWENRDPEAVEQVRALYGEVLDYAVISRREQRGREFDPSRVQVTWRS